MEKAPHDLQPPAESAAGGSLPDLAPAGADTGTQSC